MQGLTRGQIIKESGGCFYVKTDGAVYPCSARGKLRKKGELYVGDYVDVDLSGDPVIEKLLPRDSMLTRPYVSNIEGIAVVVAVEPKPDFLLTDKLIVGCVQQQLDAIVCVNKSDLKDSEKLFCKVFDE